MTAKPRKLLVLWHRWFGLLAGLWIIALAATGSVLVFYDELDRWLNPDLHKVSPTQTPMAVHHWIASATKARPDGFVRFIMMPSRADGSARLQLAARPDTDGDADGLSLYINPYTAEVIGERRAEVLRLDRRHIMNVIYELHIDFLLGQYMFWFFGLVALLWLIDHVLSLFISFNRLTKWRNNFKIRFAAGGYKRLFDLHRASGLWIFPVTLMLAVSGIYFTWYDTFNSVVNKVSPITPRYIFTLPSIDGAPIDAPIDMARAIDIAHSLSEDRGVSMATFIAPKGVYEVRAFDERDIDPYGRRMIVIDAQDGSIHSDRHITEGGAGNVFIAWQYPLHSGKAFGWPGRLVIFFTGVIIILLAVTGVKIWLRKRSSAIKAEMGNQYPA